MPDGWPTLLNQYFTRHRKEIIRVTLSNMNRKFPLYRYEQIQEDNCRIVQVINDDDEWKFFQSGSLLKFENDIYYKNRRIADRLNNEIIKEYLRSNNIDIDHPEFWKSKEPAVVFATRLRISSPPGLN